MHVCPREGRQLRRHLKMLYIHFHELCYKMAVNMHRLTDNFYTVSEILGDVNIYFEISTTLE